MIPREAIIPLIRSGEWARIIGIIILSGRVCFEIEFIDGRRDQWPVQDPAANYEYAPDGENSEKGESV